MTSNQNQHVANSLQNQPKIKLRITFASEKMHRASALIIFIGVLSEDLVILNHDHGPQFGQECTPP